VAPITPEARKALNKRSDAGVTPLQLACQLDDAKSGAHHATASLLTLAPAIPLFQAFSNQRR
jgi:hypothetical protein